MTPTQRKLNVFILLVAMAVVAAPLPAVAASATVGDAADGAGNESCCEGENQPCSQTADDTAGTPDIDGCCPDGCRHCSQPCCARAASLPAPPVNLRQCLISLGTIADDEDRIPPSQPDEIDHPPRS